MTLQSNAHPRLKPEFENGARRCDIETAIWLCLEADENSPVTVGHVCEFCLRLGYLDADYKQIARVLSQMADKGILARITIYGRYYYFAPPDGAVRRVSD